MEEKRCKICGRMLPLTEFYTQKGRWSVTCSYCKECCREKQRKYYYVHREHYLKYMREYNRIKI